MSTFNGGFKIERQIESIMDQQDVDVHLLIRDDGSSESTRNIIMKLVKRFPDRITVNFKKNFGWKKSFIDLLFLAPCSYDYYGFSDQDDIWMKDKLISCIELMEADNNSGIKLTHCNALSVDKNLRKRVQQESRIACPPNFKSAVATEYFQGCGMVWNQEAMKKLQEYKPKNSNIAHDYWVGLVCYLMGKVYFCKEPKFYHIRYGNNASADGSILKGRFNRLKMLVKCKHPYMNPAKDLLLGYKSQLNLDVSEFLSDLSEYNSSTKKKIKLFFDCDFRRPSIAASFLLKLAVLFNRF